MHRRTIRIVAALGIAGLVAAGAACEPYYGYGGTVAYGGYTSPYYGYGYGYYPHYGFAYPYGGIHVAPHVYGGGPISGAVAGAFAREGARVFLAGRSAAKLESIAGEIRSRGGVADTTGPRNGRRFRNRLRRCRDDYSVYRASDSLSQGELGREPARAPRDVGHAEYAAVRHRRQLLIPRR